MNIEDQVCSVEYAKRLKELGVKQESLFYYSMCNACAEEYKISLDETLELAQGTTHEDNYSAFTVAELGEMLGDQMASGNGGKQYNNKYICFSIVYTNEFKPKHKGSQTTAKTEADARAQMLTWLIENKYMEVSNE